MSLAVQINVALRERIGLENWQQKRVKNEGNTAFKLDMYL